MPDQFKIIPPPPLDAPFTPNEVMRISLLVMEETDDDIDIQSTLYLRPDLDPATYAPAFVKILSQFLEQMKGAEKRIAARRGDN